MPWVRLDDGFADHPKLEQAGPLAAWLHVAALCYCARHLTDGCIPKPKALRLTDVPRPAQRVDALLAAGLWEDEGDHYRVHDYLEFQPSREQVEADRAAARDRMARVRSHRSSGEQQPNVREKFADRSPYPGPTRPVTPEGLPIRAPAPINGTRALAVIDSDFDDFWRAYPARKGKPAARKAWANAIKRATPETIIAGARRYANDPARDPEHTKYPQGWLNDDRWTDEPTTRPTISRNAGANLAWAERTS